MEKLCEFCKLLSPVVYCTADAAYLCLSCDAKVHSANALSYRHNRTLVCQLCGTQPVYVRCVEHQMFLCQCCDTNSHVSFQHNRKVVNSYVGSPCAKELAALWEFDLNELKNNYLGTESEDGSISRAAKVGKNDNNQQKACLILQQILDLERLQHFGGIKNSSSPHLKDRITRLSLKHDTTWKTHRNINNKMEHIDQHPDFHEPKDSPYSETDEESLHADLFWQYRSPAHNNESWFHNMQDIGVCDEQCYDDLSIPDVDLTFRNFEELFGSEHESSQMQVDEKHSVLFGELGYACPVQDVTELSSATSSSCISRIRGESIDLEFKEDGSFKHDVNQQAVNGSSFPNNSHLDGKKNMFMKRNKEKKLLRYKSSSKHEA